MLIFYQYQIITMNIFYFVKRWPRYHQNAISDKILSLTQTLLNADKKVFLISADTAPESALADVQQMPVEIVHVNPNKVWSSLSYNRDKPELALFNSVEMEEMYSLYLYSKFNKCPRVLQINSIDGVTQWRKKNYAIGNPSFLHQYDAQSCPSGVFTARQLQAVRRSDYFFCGNQFVSHQLKQATGTSNYILSSLGVPINEFQNQIHQLKFRTFRHRKNFAYFGNLADQNNREIIEILMEKVWPIIRKTLTSVQLHLIGDGYNSSLSARKNELSKQGIILKGAVESPQQLQKYRATLYPIRSACSSKGAIIESWFNHTPVITTPVGAQGLFLSTTQPMFSAEQDGKAYNGFFKERTFTKEQERAATKLKKYYESNKLTQQVGQFEFGGLCNSFSLGDFARNAIELYNNQQLWEKSLLSSRKSILQNQSEMQLEVNLNIGISQVEYNLFENRKKKEYLDEWDRYLKSQEAQIRLKQRHVK